MGLQIDRSLPDISQPIRLTITSRRMCQLALLGRPDRQDVGGGLGEPIRASAGAFYYAEDQGIGIASEEEFAKYLYEQVGWGKLGVQEAVDDVKKRM